VQSDSVAVKAALLDVVDFLHQWADVQSALHMPDQGASPMPRDTYSSFASPSEIPTGLPGDKCLVFSG
jgi:hypothetical protein